MNLTIKPCEKLKGQLMLPASKSYSIRAFIIAACGGFSTIKNPSNCDDALVAMSVARALGAKVKKRGVHVFEVDARKSKTLPDEINVRESGTALRFLLPLVALKDSRVVVSGSGTLVGRPNMFLNQTLREMDVDIKGQGKKESVPIVVHGGSMQGGKIQIDGSLSSQFISALLIACPQLKENTDLALKGKKLVSLDYIMMTQQVLNKCGIKVSKKGQRTYVIKGNQTFKGLKSFCVPSDYGLAAFHLAAAALTESNVVLKGHFDDSLVQADGYIIPLLRKMGVKFSKDKHFIKIRGPFKLKGGDFSLKDAPDLVPIMAVLALFAKGRTRLYDIAHARSKESDRISDLRKELVKVGAKIKESANELIVYPQDSYKTNVQLNPHHDHRLAMAFSVLGLKVGVSIKDIECVSKSYPDFVKDFRLIGAKARRSLQ